MLADGLLAFPSAPSDPNTVTASLQHEVREREAELIARLEVVADKERDMVEQVLFSLLRVLLLLLLLLLLLRLRFCVRVRVDVRVQLILLILILLSIVPPLSPFRNTPRWSRRASSWHGRRCSSTRRQPSPRTRS